MKQVLVELQYFPSIYWFALFHYADQIVLNDRESFRKQTYRSRATIAGANKPLNLIVPVKQGKSKQAVQAVQISRETNWQRHQWQTIRSAYQSAPYFDHYASTIKPLFETQIPTLFSLNLEILHTLSAMLQWGKPPYTRASEWESIQDIEDFTGAIRPKKKNRGPALPFKDVPYPQVFQERFGFIPGLSILDLLFNCGPDADRILRAMV